MAGEKSKPVLFVGAVDKICAQAIEFFAVATNAHLLLVDDADEDTIRQATLKVPAGRASYRKVDIYKPSELHAAVACAGLVVNGRQPYHRSSRAVIRACIEAKVAYLDYSDDVKSTQDSLSLAELAKNAGIPCYINCGAAPGMSNIMAVDAAKGMDSIDAIDVCWYLTDQGGANGKEVLEHLMDITAGPCLTWADGRATIHENWVETAHTPIGPNGADVILHESVHPEPITLARAFPKTTRIRCLGAINPAPFNGFAQGLGKAVATGTMSMDVACDFLWDLSTQSKSKSQEGTRSAGLGAFISHLRGGDISLNELVQLLGHVAGSLDPWRHAFGGMLDDVRKGYCSYVDVIKFLTYSAVGRKFPYEAGMLVRVIGTRNGTPVEVIKRRPASGAGASMAADIGASSATFITMIWENELGRRTGVYCPEDWVDPQTFYKCMERLGFHSEQIVETA
ncbi:hypothetical protein RBB50_011482 [Rhinocladiella similis]